MFLVLLRRRVGLAISFLALAAAQAWPLPRLLATHVTGEIGGDTGVYIWNLWVFRHELLERLTNPFSTLSILPLDGPTDLSLHNYTVFSDLLALPLLSLFGVITTFNLVYLINVALAAAGMYLLARRIGASAGVGIGEAWLAALLFACSPFLVARSTAHFSLAAAAPLPFFVRAVDHAWASQRLRHAILAGACVAWAAYADPYYAVYCVLLGLFVVGHQVMRVRALARRPDALRTRHARRIVDVTLLALGVAIVATRWVPGGTVHVGALTISMRTLYTPVLLASALLIARMWLTWRVQLGWRVPPWPITRRLVGIGMLAVMVAAVLLAPELYALVVRAAEGQMVAPPVLWRSSAPGVDLVSFFLPNPNHALAPQRLVAWVAHQPGRFEENVVAIPWVALGTILLAWRWAGARMSGLWVGIAVFFAMLSLGPFVRIAGVDTYVPTPWTLLRYVPLLAEARMPPRFGVIVIMAMGVLFALALAAVTRARPHQRRLILGVTGVLLAVELLPVPRTLYAARVPAVYQRIASDSRPVRVLELPFGIRDGLSSLGDFSAASQFYQTAHHKPLISGYLSRVTEPTKAYHRNIPVLDALLDLSEGRPLTPEQRARAEASAGDFLREARVGYVIVDTRRGPPALTRFAREVLHLQPLDDQEGFELLVPAPTASASGIEPR